MKSVTQIVIDWNLSVRRALAVPFRIAGRTKITAFVKIAAPRQTKRNDFNGVLGGTMNSAIEQPIRRELFTRRIFPTRFIGIALLDS